MSEEDMIEEKNENILNKENSNTHVQEDGHSFECPAFVQREESSIKNTVDNTENADNYRNPDGTFKAGNPGKPKGTKHFATLIKEALKHGRVKYKDPTTGEETIITKEQALIHNLTDKAVLNGGRLDAIEVILDRVEGKPKTSVAIGPDDEVDGIEVRIIKGNYGEREKDNGHERNRDSGEESN